MGSARRPDNSPLRAGAKTQRLGKALRRRIVRERLALDEDRTHAIIAVQALEGFDLLVHPAGGGSGGRADHHQKQRLLQGGRDLRGQVRGCAEFIAIAEDRLQAIWNRPERSRASDDRAGQPVGFEPAMNPLAPACVAMAVADEGPVLSGFVQRCSPDPFPEEYGGGLGKTSALMTEQQRCGSESAAGPAIRRSGVIKCAYEQHVRRPEFVADLDPAFVARHQRPRVGATTGQASPAL